MAQAGAPPRAPALAREDLTIDELIALAEELLAQVAPEQTRYKVRERPDVRTIRYYVTQGLLPKPFGYAGGRARYGGTHLLRLLFIKRRQAEHETLARITRELAALDDPALESRLFGAAAGAPAPPLERSVPSTASSPAPSTASSPAPSTASSPAPSTASSPAPSTASSPAAVPPETRRLSLSPGGTVEVPSAVLTDPAARLTLAHSLEELAAWLRTSSEGHR